MLIKFFKKHSRKQLIMNDANLNEMKLKKR